MLARNFKFFTDVKFGTDEASLLVNGQTPAAPTENQWRPQQVGALTYFDVAHIGKKWRGEFERLAKEKSTLANERDDLQRRLKDAEEDKARAQRSHDKELAHAAELSAQKVQVADLTGYARAINEANRPRATFNTPSPSTCNQDDGSLKFLLGTMPSQYPPPSAHLATWGMPGMGCGHRLMSGEGCGRRDNPCKHNAGPAPRLRLRLLQRARWH